MSNYIDIYIFIKIDKNNFYGLNKKWGLKIKI